MSTQTGRRGGRWRRGGNTRTTAGGMDESTAERMASVFRIMADPTRVRIIASLLEGELCVGELAARLGMSASAVSHQLRTLREMRLVRRRREGKRIFYTLDDEHVEGLFQQALEHVRHE